MAVSNNITVVLTVHGARAELPVGERAREVRRRALRRRGARLVVRAPAVAEARAQPREQRALLGRLRRHQPYQYTGYSDIQS